MHTARIPPVNPTPATITAVHVARASGIRFTFERKDRQSHVNSYSFYLSYQGALPNPNTVKVDITISEVLYFPVEQRPVLRAYPEFEDLPEDRLTAVYSLNEIATEKVVALSDPARNGLRDLYDLWFLTGFLTVDTGVDLAQLVPAIAENFASETRTLPASKGAFSKKSSD
jgi:predicted nucleotidyltransferase component of viral defense system